MEKEREEDLEILVRKYQGIGPLLTKVEGLVVHTNTGRNPKMSQYYAYWELKIFKAIVKVGLYKAA